jgi:hypothetical protein
MGAQKKAGRPGANRAKYGRVRAAVRPELKAEAEAIVADDSRLRTLSHMIEVSLDFYIREYKKVNKQIDKQCFPNPDPRRSFRRPDLVIQCRSSSWTNSLLVGWPSLRPMKVA